MAEKDRRKVVDFAKRFLKKGKKKDIISAELALKFGGKSDDYRTHVRQALKEMDYAEEARRAIAEHLKLGGGFDYRPWKFSDLVFRGPAHPRCPLGAIKAEVEVLVRKWKEDAKSIFGPQWRKRLDFAKSALEDAGEAKKTEDLYRVRWSGDNPILRQKVFSVAKRELSRDSISNRLISPVMKIVSAKTKPDRKARRAERKAVKETCRRRDKKRMTLIFGGLR